ncbi:hypothetical protein [Lentiprolixibacter aurantiacus]|uniref:Uncharacterized protein n=1 Tax=Lentiprolixibacter aurantiacus TaxID=2993939 RepID=A0AAE3MLF9_9FLAO|nr:hypothetical protein [Lentiprolixibacter aurantiacus]MCX2719578.1 hypothetical protein [Lentiprolixibacter aurantiacus]
MQTLSRYFVAFLLVLVTNFVGDSESENQKHHAYQPQKEVQKAPAQKVMLEYRFTRCS